MEHTKGYLSKGKGKLECKLNKSLYVIKQVLRQWYKKFDGFMHEIAFSRCEAGHCCYCKKTGNGFIILLLYVDDMLIASSNTLEVSNLKKQLSERFVMKDLDETKQILGMRIDRDRVAGKLYLSQAEYIKKVLSRFGMKNAKPTSTPLGNHFKLSERYSPNSQEERSQMQKTPYASAIDSLM